MSALERVTRAFWDSFRPPPNYTLSEWADEHFYLSSESSAQTGKWRTIPYQRGIMDAITQRGIEEVWVIKSARVGYTKIIDIVVGYHVHQRPCPIMIVQPTIEDAEGFSKDEIAPMIRDVPVLRDLAPEMKAKTTSETILHKIFKNQASVSMVGANSPRGFRRVSRRLVLFDETDGYPPSAGAEGDQISLGKKRAEYYADRKIIGGSTPTIKDHSRIEKEFLKTDQRRYFVPCPHCGVFQVLKFGTPDDAFGFKWEKARPETVYYMCEGNQCKIEHKWKRWMVERGEWRATAVGKPKTAGFHIWSAYSYSPNATWQHIVTEFLETKDDPLQLQTFTNTWLGETFEVKGDRVPTSGLLERREHYKQLTPMPEGYPKPWEHQALPAWVSVLTCCADIQGNRIEAKIKGWGANEESCLVAYEIFYGNPSQDSQDDADGVWGQLDMFRMQIFESEAGFQLRPVLTLVDSGDESDAVYDYVFPRQNLRDRVYAVKGVERIAGQVAMVKEGNAKRHKIRLFTVDTRAAKDRIMSRLQMQIPNPPEPNKAYMHFPIWADQEYFDQLTSEKKIPERNPKTRTVHMRYVKAHDRNEALDLEVYNLAALWIVQNILDPVTFSDLGALNAALRGAAPLPKGRGRRIRNKGLA